MAIGHIELNAAMTRIQDYTAQKHNEDQRGAIQNDHMQNHFTKELKQDMKQVVKTDQSEYQNKTQYQNKKFDAREKGSNQYTGDGGKNRRQKEDAKSKDLPGQYSGFDIKI